MSGDDAPEFTTSDRHAMVLALAAGYQIAESAFDPAGRVSLNFSGVPPDFELLVANGSLPPLEARKAALTTVDSLIRSANGGGGA